MTNDQDIQLIKKTIEQFEHIRQFRKVTYLGEKYHVAYEIMLLLLKNNFTEEEFNKALKIFEIGRASCVNNEDKFSAFGEHCSNCLSQLRICEIKLTHFKMDRNGILSSVNFTSLGLEPKLGELLEHRWTEAQKCRNSGAYLAATIIMGSFLEGLLVGLFSKNQSILSQCKSAPKDQKSNKTKDLSRWKLVEMINVAHSLGWIDTDGKKFSHSLREFRNLIHPFEQMRTSNYPDKDTCEISWLVVQAICNDLVAMKKSHTV